MRQRYYVAVRILVSKRESITEFVACDLILTSAEDKVFSHIFARVRLVEHVIRLEE